MTARLEFFYDYVSVYSYLADSQLRTLGDVEVIYRPMLLGAVMEATGNRPPGMVQAKGRYLDKDLARWADRYGLPLKFNPKFPQQTVQALRLALVAQYKGGFDEIHRALFEAMWIHEKDLGDVAVLAEAAGERAGDYLRATQDQAIKDELRANTEEAIARGAFGAPTFFVGAEMFFGNDRFEFIKAELNKSA